MPPKGRKAANGYKLPDPIPLGEVVQAVQAKKSWKLGKSIGVGGFGEIYLANENSASKVTDDNAKLAVKIEPHENGPLFVEMNFYIRAAQPDMIQEFRKKRKLTSTLGMPALRGSGSHIHSRTGDKYRFLVMDRYGKDLQKIFDNGKRLFPLQTAYNLAVKILDVLEYIHSKGYVHNDIKAQNLLLGYGRAHEHDVYLVDFGLVSKYVREGVHHEYKPDARKAHDGTIEYTSRDAHIGAHSRRSDLEILGYNLAHWLSGTLPWMDNLANPKQVQNQKNSAMQNIPAFLSRCFGNDDYPGELLDFLTYVAKLNFETEPDYDRCRDMFKAALKKRRLPCDGKIDFSAPKSPAKKARKSRQTRSNNPRNPITPRPTPAASPSPLDGLSPIETGAVTRSVENEEMERWCWESVLCSDPEMLIRQASRQSETDQDESPLAMQHRLLDEKRQKESLRNPTAAMLQIIARIEQREKERQNMTWQQQLQHLQQRKTGGALNRNHNAAANLTPNPLTPAMEEVIEMRQKRVSFDYDIPITPDPSSDEDDDDDDVSSHEEFIPPASLIKKQQQQHHHHHHHHHAATSRANNGGSPDKSNLSVEFDDEEDDDGEFGGLVLNESILKFLKEDGVNLAEQRQEFLKYETVDENGGASTSTGKVKTRRISYQNEVVPIRNKSSPPDPVSPVPSTSTAGFGASPGGGPVIMRKGKRAAVEKWIVGKNEVKTSTPVKKPVQIAQPTKKGGRKRKKSSADHEEPAAVEESPPIKRQTRQGLKRAVAKRPAKVADIKDESDDDDEVIVSRSATPRASPPPPPLAAVSSKAAAASKSKSIKGGKKSSAATKKSAVATRRMRSRCDSQSWDWGQVLLSNPEKIISRSKRK